MNPSQIKVFQKLDLLPVPEPIDPLKRKRGRSLRKNPAI